MYVIQMESKQYLARKEPNLLWCIKMSFRFALVVSTIINCYLFILAVLARAKPNPRRREPRFKVSRRYNSYIYFDSKMVFTPCSAGPGVR
jgi:hypothetical protein